MAGKLAAFVTVRSNDAYTRLYHRFAKEYPRVYADDHLLATWVRLLMLADASWPLQTPMPRSAKAAYVKRLTEPYSASDGSILPALVIVDGDWYTVLGLDAERTRRSNAGRAGADARWHGDGTAGGNAIAMPSRDEPSKDKPNTPPPPAERGRRENGTNPRARGSSPRTTATNPRANGTSTRARRKAEKTGSTNLGAVLRRAAEIGRPS